MALYIAKRLLQVIPVFLGSTLLIYFMVFSVPGDPVAALFGERQPPQEVIDSLRAQYNLDKSFIEQYFIYIQNLLQLNLGVTFSGRSVNEVLWQAFPVTARLAVMAIIVEFLLAVTIGVISGFTKGRVFDNVNLVIGLIFIAVPVFVFAFMAQFFLAVKLGWFAPTVGANNDWGGLILPALVLGFSVYPLSMRLMRGSIIETMNQDWVRTAYSKGLSRRRVIPVHVIRNSLIPVITHSATSFGVLMVGATVTEGIFNIPGVGNVLFDAIRAGEGPTVVSFVSIFVVLYLIVNLFVDLLYGLLDPRIRYAK